MENKVYQSRVDEVIARRDAWQKEFDAKRAIYDEQHNAYYNACKDVIESKKNEIRNAIGRENYSERLNIRIDMWDMNKIEIRISYADDIFNKAKALSWNYDVDVNTDGTVIKKSSSYSGLQVITDEQVEDLEITLNLIKALNKIDWYDIVKSLYVDYPVWSDYITAKQPEVINWTKEITFASIADTIDKNILVKGTGTRGGTIYYKVIRATTKQYEVISIDGYYVDRAKNDDNDTVEKCVERYMNTYHTNRISKENFYDRVYEYKTDKGVAVLEY